MRLLASFALLAILVTPAAAETDWTKYGNFAATRCEDAQTIADIKEAAKGHRFDEGGAPITSVMTGLAITSSKTLRATSNKLICQLQIEFITQGQTHHQRGKYTVQIYPDGRWRTHFEPNY